MLWVLAGVAIVSLVIFAQIDDWSRDWTTNVAATDEAAGNLRPLTLDLPLDQAADRLRRVVGSLPRWQAVAWPSEPPTPDAALEVALVRTTPLLRFKDDVQVRMVASPDGRSTTVHIRSQSRIGRGDLGQNPRNIRELLDRLAAGHLVP
jgi:uncharacterized protein (DUF1499 family)